MHFRFSSIAFLLLGLFSRFGYADNAALPLKLDRSFKRSPATSESAAAFINARHVEARKDDQLEAYGDVELRQSGRVVKTDHLLYGQESKDVLAEGSVRFEQSGLVVTGPVLKLNLDTGIGQMTQPQFEFSENHARGAAEVMHIAGKKNFTFDDATYTTCPAGKDDWLLRVNRLDIDRATQVGVARSAVVEFKGVPILYTPWMDFPLNDDRRSGLMAPSYGFSSKSGYELMLPYYWNIASNFDATISPRVMSKRGTQFNNEFRYLQPNYAGEAQYDVLSNDRVSGLTRTHMALLHNQNLGGGFGLGLNLNRVSDDDYFRDLSTSVAGTSQTNLLRDGMLSYGAGWWSASARIQRYQTLQDPLAPVVAPYRRQPQVTLNAQQTLDDASIVLASEYTDFRHDTSVNGQRLVFYPSASYPLLNDLGYYMTPKLGVHYTKYLMGTNNTQAHPDTVRTLPIFSLDNGMVFERDDSILGSSYIQTLEPRLFYVYIPYKDQDMLPNFDSAQAPFNFGQIFTENRFFGSDRIGDANMATLALTSRLIDNEGGVERLRVMLGERFSFKAPKVTLSGAPTDNTSRSDILLSVGGQISRSWSLDSLYQYNPNQSHTESYNAMARYKPEPGKLLNLSYSFTRNTLRQTDISTQWPLFGRWQGMARLSYSLQDKRITEALAGLEYNQACWAVRMGTQSFSTASSQRNSSFFLQLELNDLVHIGSDAMDILRNSVSGYTKMNSLPAEQSVPGLR
ncbi:MAG: LPS-assembly protein LptD [Gammaproteobacteria bacterium]|nr:LPS-assembly protein LptD [Gammaproteobacteria bacterium]MBU1482588.1 LPS-assembly protein LptD [Gammaproteobacteria bacterium]